MRRTSHLDWTDQSARTWGPPTIGGMRTTGRNGAALRAAGTALAAGTVLAIVQAPATAAPVSAEASTPSVVPANPQGTARSGTPRRVRLPAPSPAQVLAAVRASGVKLVVERGWNKEWDLPSRRWDWKPVGVMLHHTASTARGNAPSRTYLRDYMQPMRLPKYDGKKGGARGCNFLIGRDGTVYFMRATRGPHAGTGPGMRLGRDWIGPDNGNGRTFGIEIESAGTSTQIHASTTAVNGFSRAQVDATVRLSAALLELIDRPVTNLTDHKAWAPGRKGDLQGEMLGYFKKKTAKRLASISRS